MPTRPRMRGSAPSVAPSVEAMIAMLDEEMLAVDKENISVHDAAAHPEDAAVRVSNAQRVLL